MFGIKFATGRIRPQGGHQTLKIDREQSESFPLSSVRIEKNVVFGATVNRRRFRIQQLQRIPAASGPGQTSFGILSSERRRCLRRTRFPGRLGGECFLLRLRGLREGEAREHHKNPKQHELFHLFSPVKVGSCPFDSSSAELSRQMDYLEKARRVLELEIGELQRLRQRLGDDFSRAVAFIKDAVDARGKVVVLGVGKSGHIGSKIASTLTSTGSPAVVLDSLNALHGDLGVVADGDVILALSSSGETEELVRILPAIGRFQVKVIAMCGDANSTLANNAHVVLDVNVEQEACPLNLAPTSSTTAMLALGDALAMVLLEARGFNKEDFAKFHPGGKIGRSLLMRVHQLMRPRESMAVVPPTATVREVLKAMTSVRAGAAVVAGEDRQLLGIFTHGDFARHFQSDPKVGERVVADLMTLNPVTVHKDKLAVEVLKLLESHRIDDLVVVDDDKVPVGVVDSQDLTRLKLL